MLLKRGLTLCLFMCLSFVAKSEEVQPNFLFIAVDDLNVFNTAMQHHESSFLQRVYPDETSRQQVYDRLTPNLASLAHKGVTFNYAYSAAPLCGPSRTALLTGVPPHISGYDNHQKHFRHHESLANVVTLPQYLRRNGYFTAGVGKVFHKGRAVYEKGHFNDWPDRLFSWDEWLEMYVGNGNQSGLSPSARETLSPYYLGDEKSYKRFGITEVQTEFSNDYRNMEFVAELLLNGESSRVDANGEQRTVVLPKDKPFFLAAGMFAPHLPFVAEQKYFDLFPQNEMAINGEFVEQLVDEVSGLSTGADKLVRDSSFVQLLAQNEARGSGLGVAAFKAKLQAYLATIAYADQSIGVLLNAIDEHPLSSNTVVILWSDHGYHLGDKLREGKITLWEPANLANLIIIDPRASDAMQRTTDVKVSLQDLYPTIVELAGLSIPRHVHGTSLVDVINNDESNWENAVLNTNGLGNHAVRTDEYRYIRYRDGSEELFNMVNDPFEIDNLVSSAESKEQLDSHRRLLDRLLAKRTH
ncbi:sulfatase-like hydrolase/transferase [Alteromonas sp. KUL49]|uniref:sulfatase-like hydrolase/transferase n=1 Tax=Alteromonas sp. KUL49 TaxID=2480798 RepID=UPI00102F16B3|nr:sulfatase-like hydrolase/transferase [Alteromonas sp. KUL49]TAP39432.1 hypothetical protein EYS00_12935 [Alteromonas sp. KUL49]GEA12231.1 choline-sulfatase [Alteromonas sp. KUL49]